MNAQSTTNPAQGVTDGETILATKTIPATPERLFQAITTDEAETWWGSPETYQIADWKADLKIDGRWSLNTLPKEGGILPGSGEFLEIDTPHKLVLTRRYDFDFPELGRRVTTVTYRLEPVEGGTRFTVRQDGFAGLRTSADTHVIGWVRWLEWLGAYVTIE